MREKKSNLKKILEYIFSVILILALILVILWALFFYKVLPTPSFLSALFNSEDEVDSSYYNEERFYDYLESISDAETEIRTLTVEIDNVSDFINAVKVRDNYYWELEVENFYGGESNKYSHSVWATDKKLRVDSTSKYSDTTTVIDEDGVRIRNNKNGETNVFGTDAKLTFSSVVNIADIEFYLESKQSEIQEAGLIDTDTEKYLYVRVYTESLDKTDEFYVSLDSGIVLFASSEIASERVFVQTTRELRTNYTAASDIFRI
ncbi:MAG: hypothetical protein IJP16_10600 [Clostridia bacterium]|nr:hypothetical protein [Clostridia bacterium]